MTCQVSALRENIILYWIPLLIWSLHAMMAYFWTNSPPLFSLFAIAAMLTFRWRNAIKLFFVTFDR